MQLTTRLVEDVAGVTVDLLQAIADDAAVLVSGSVPTACYKAIASRASQMTVFFAEERMVAADHPDSTHGRVSRAWPGVNAHRIPGELGAIEAARRASRVVRDHAGDPPQLALALLALGDEGQIAALYPGDHALGASALYFPARGGVWVTATLALINRAAHVVVIAAEATAAPILRAPPSPDVPASLIRADAVTWLLERAK